ncbi:MAG: RecQ family ATP-dependent DNA helicase, partial [Oscillospiraceae bacterium]|nr:RecQ family ATP-dependent DNA helicase [Oscillospiraceae bacterium]
MKNRFGYDSFRPGQEEVIDAILSGRDTLAVMPTGAGKSLCYQIPAMLLPGITIVISPLISLMKDQVKALRAAGCPAVFLNSSLGASDYRDTMGEINSGGVKLLYIAPERLQRTAASLFSNNTPSGVAPLSPPLIVIDEAHCVSQWGHDFRTSYLEIAAFIKGIEPRPITAAFTATATPKVKEDIERFLRLRDPFLINTGYDRPNLFFEVIKPSNKTAALLECLEQRRQTSGIVYCATRKAVDELYDLLPSRGFSVTRYHAGLDDGERRKNQDDFIYDRKTVMLATNAFGMGIDKSNVSFVIHYNMPKNIESYYQEAGRAGRDGAPADCILLYSGQDVHINEYLISHSDEDKSPDPALQAHYRDLLRQITFYATGNECLRRRILSYFGEESPAYCGRCSNCLIEYEQADISPEAVKIISCVRQLRQRNRSFGKTMIIDILRGSKNEKIQKFGLDSLRAWGSMAETTARRVRTILDFLIDEDCLASEGDEYPVVVLGRAYGEMAEGQRLFMKLPREKRRIQAPEENLWRQAPQTSNRRPISPKTPGAPVGVPAGIPAEIIPSSESFDRALFEKLKELRKEIAAK